MQVLDDPLVSALQLSENSAVLPLSPLNFLVYDTGVSGIFPGPQAVQANLHDSWVFVQQLFGYSPVHFQGLPSHQISDIGL